MLWLGATTIGLVVAALLGAQQMPTIRVPVRVVTVPTLVFSGEGQLISGLQKADFRVFDNGRLQTTLLDTTSAPVSVVIAVQVNQEVRSYAPFIAKAGSVVETLLVGETGEAAVIAYNGDVSVAKPFGEGDVQSTLRKLSPAGRPARMIDAGVRAIALLKERPVARARILVFIGQPMDSGSESSLDSLSGVRQGIRLRYVLPARRLLRPEGRFPGGRGLARFDCRPGSQRGRGEGRRSVLRVDRRHRRNADAFPQAAGARGRHRGHGHPITKLLSVELLSQFDRSRLPYDTRSRKCSRR